jgi:hypothetical protein
LDARLDPAKYAGLAEGDAHVIRNAGGRASDDAIRSLVISYKLLLPSARLEGTRFEPSVPRRERNESLSGTGTVTEATKVGLEAVAYLPGTDGSNPSPSSGESGANLTFGANPIVRSSRRIVGRSVM